MDIRSLDGAFDAVVRITITLICLFGTFFLSCCALSAVLR